MEVSGSDASAEVSQESSATSQEPAAEGTSQVGGSEASGATGVAETEAPAWNPNFKFKVKDKEMEFDEFIRGSVKDQSHEAKLRELYERAYGLDEVKASRAAVEQKFKEVDGKYNQVAQSLGTLGQYVQGKKYGDFFQSLNIPKQDIIDYVIEELRYQELPQEQRTAIEQQRQVERDYEIANLQNQQMYQQMQQLVTQQAKQELDMELGRSEIVQAAQMFDARLGKTGAFAQEVVRRGQYYEQVHQVSPPARQLVQEVLAFVGQPQAPVNSQAASVQKQAEKPVIPMMAGGSQKSPTHKLPTSIDDLKKLRQQRSET
jgi:hypothetical protein